MKSASIQEYVCEIQTHMCMNSGPSEYSLNGTEFWVVGHDGSGYKAMGMGRILSRGQSWQASHQSH